MPTGVGVGVSVACYEFICRMARITAESQTPTLSVCLRAKGDLGVCFCLCHYHNVPIQHPDLLILLSLRVFLPFPFTFSLTLCTPLPLSRHRFSLEGIPPYVSIYSPSSVRCPLVVLCSTFPESPYRQATVEHRHRLI